VQVLRAGLGQFRHDFAAALDDLSKVIERDTGHAGARSLCATIHIVQARYPQARTDCRALRGATSDLIAIGCEAMVDGLTGNAAGAYPVLNEALKSHPEAAHGEKLWVLIRLAEIAKRQGRSDIAESHFRQALALGITGVSFCRAAPF
jgi:Tfp pilus assembly protein PilF